jgi:hypothetical protein
VADQIRDPSVRAWAWEISRGLEQACEDIRSSRDEARAEIRAIRERLEDYIEKRNTHNESVLVRLAAIETQTAVERRMNSKWAFAVWTGLGALATAAAFLIEKVFSGRKIP